MVRVAKTKTYLLVLLLALAVSTAGETAELLSLTPVQYVGVYFKTPPGTVAFLPGALNEDDAKKTWNFRLLGKNGAYEIPEQLSCWFIVNHRDTHKPVGEVTYVAVQILLYRDKRFREPLMIFRNDGWMRLDDSDIDGDRELQRYMAKDLKKFFTLHSEEKRNRLDKFLEAKWHATPKNSSQDSWAKKVHWQDEVKDFRSKSFRAQFAPPIPERKNVSYQSYLLQFSNTHKDVSKRPVLFKFDCLNADYVWLKLFSPDEFVKEYFFTIK